MIGHTVAYLDQATVDGRVFRQVMIPTADRFPLPVRSGDGAVIGRVITAEVVDGHVDVTCVWDAVEPEWSEWCLLAELRDLDCEVVEQRIQTGALYRIEISGTLAGVTLSTPTTWPWKADTGV
jgi:hypothetical protein